MTAALVYVPGCTVLSELLCVVEADPAVTLAGKGLQQSPLGCALARCLRNNGEHTPASETTGDVVRTGAFADTKAVCGHPDRVRLEGSADGIDNPAILSEHKITGILVRTRLCVTEVTERTLLGCGIRPVLAHTVWVIIEFFSMGMLSYLYADLLTPDKKQIATTSFGTSADCLQSWLRCATDLRNRCAHYSRLYYWIFSAIPKTPQNATYEFDRRLFSQILMLKYLYPDKNKWNNEVSVNLESLIEEYLPDISLKHIGFPENWKELLKA